MQGSVCVDTCVLTDIRGKTFTTVQKCQLLKQQGDYCPMNKSNTFLFAFSQQAQWACTWIMYVYTHIDG